MAPSSVKQIEKNPVDWLLHLIEDLFSQHYDGDTLNRLLMSEESAQLRTAFFQELLANFKVVPAPFGERALEFLSESEKYSKEWSPPYSAYKVADISKTLLLLDNDLIQNESWEKLKNLLADNRRTLTEQKGTIESIDTIMQQLRIGYRYHVIDSAFFHRKSESETDSVYVLNDRHFKATIYLINQSIVIDAPEESYQVVSKYCEEKLREEVASLLSFSKKKSEEGLFLLHVSYHVKNQMHVLKSTPEYAFLPPAIREVILKSACDYLDTINAVMGRINIMLLSLCEQAKAGVLIGPFVLKEITALVKEQIFAQFTSLGALVVISYLNSPEMIKWVHDTVMKVRANHIKPLLENENDLSLLKAELKKATHYRGRRDLIEQLYYLVLEQNNQKTKWYQADISEAQQKRMLFLQYEYLHALTCQTEDMPQREGIQFMEKFLEHDIFQALPKTKFFSSPNHQALDSLKLNIYDLKHGVKAQSMPKEDPQLDHMDCPIEQDIIGGVSKRLADLIMHKNKSGRKFLRVVEMLESTYQRLMAPDFEVEASIEDYAMANDFKRLHSDIYEEEDIQLRLERILELFDYIKNNQHWDIKNKLFQVLDSKVVIRHPQFQAISALQELYIECLSELLQTVANEDDSARNTIYERVILPSLEAELFNNDLVPRLCQKSKRQIQLMCDSLVRH
tara:strand:+ start:47907 stop:49946 length:2040 start_codon:yes stop_codon:yes gene_type:complete